AAVTPQHVAESHGDEFGSLGCPVAQHSRDNQLCNALGHPHHADGIDRLVGGDHQEARDAIAVGRLDHVPGAQNVGLHSLRDVNLHYRNVLVSGGMKNRLHRVSADHFFDPWRVANVRDFGDKIERWELSAEFKIDLEQLALRLVQGNQLARFKAGHL